MEKQAIIDNVIRIKSVLANGNAYGEPVYLVAATKMQTTEAINAAISAGVDAVAENRVQEFRDKTEELLACPQHFIGHLQTNKVKYLVGKIDLFHSCDRYELALEISRLSVVRGVVSNVLVQINAGDEATKGGFPIEKAHEAYQTIKSMPGIRVKGFMAMLPHSKDEGLLAALADTMRKIYEQARSQDGEIEYLSMGMSGDYRLCIEHGSNMIRVGSTIFGERDYGKA